MLVPEGGTRVRLRSDVRGTTYTIRTADGRRSGERRADPFVALANRRFDPLLEVPAARLLPASGRLRLIQFETRRLAAYDAALRALGVEILRFVPGQTVIADVPPSVEDELRALDFVRWVGPFRAEDRLAPELLDDLLHGRRTGSDVYTVQRMRPAADGYLFELSLIHI